MCINLPTEKIQIVDAFFMKSGSNELTQLVSQSVVVSAVAVCSHEIVCTRLPAAHWDSGRSRRRALISSLCSRHVLAVLPQSLENEICLANQTVGSAEHVIRSKIGQI